MIINDVVEVPVNMSNYEYYFSRGYDIPTHIYRGKIRVPKGTKIKVKLDDLQKYSSTFIECKCDYCGKIFKKKYSEYIESRTILDKDCCNNMECITQKRLESVEAKYGTTSMAQIIIANDNKPGRKYKYNKSDIDNMCLIKGYEIKKIDGVGTKNRILLFCTKHNIEFETTIDGLMNEDRKNCPSCQSEKMSKTQSKSSIEEVRKICNEKDYTLLTEYINNCDDTIEYMCNKHKDYGIQKTSLYGLRKYDNNCRMCRLPKKENHWHWNGGISSERDKIKNTPQYKKWVQDVFKRDDYTCQCCGRKGVYLEAHHLYNFSDYPELRMDIDNGITLCHECHSISVPTSFHGIYTQYHNTPEQLYEYIDNYKLKKCS